MLWNTKKTPTSEEDIIKPMYPYASQNMLENNLFNIITTFIN